MLEPNKKTTGKNEAKCRNICYVSIKFNEDEDNYTNEMSKMKTLRDILMNPTKRLQMGTLDKCEKVLQNWLGAKAAKVLGN